MKVDKLYSYDLENKQLIKEAPFNDIGLAEVYEVSQELYKNNIGKNIAILGVNAEGEIFFKKTKDIDFNSKGDPKVRILYDYGDTEYLHDKRMSSVDYKG